MLNVDKFPLFKPGYDPVTVTPQEVRDALDFFQHDLGQTGEFTPLSPRLQHISDELDKRGTITPEFQFIMKIAICKEIATSQLPALTDDMFKDIRKECKSLIAKKNVGFITKK